MHDKCTNVKILLWKYHPWRVFTCFHLIINLQMEIFHSHVSYETIEIILRFLEDTEIAFVIVMKAK